MAEFESKLIRKEQIAEGTMAFYLEKPKELTYIAGQHPTFQLVHPVETDEEGDSRTFSFITIPSDTEVGFATRMRDTAFKRNLKNAEPGLDILIKNPRGSLVLPADTKRPMVMLVGGIGITPMISIIREASLQKSEQQITLFYANRTIAQTAFFEQLKQVSQENSHFTFIPVMTQEDPHKWNGETGHITKEMLKKYVPDTSNTLFYLAGPTGMVSAMTNMLTNAGIDSLFIKSEDYGEYK